MRAATRCRHATSWARATAMAVGLGVGAGDDVTTGQTVCSDGGATR